MFTIIRVHSCLQLYQPNEKKESHFFSVLIYIISARFFKNYHTKKTGTNTLTKAVWKKGARLS